MPDSHPQGRTQHRIPAAGPTVEVPVLAFSVYDGPDPEWARPQERIGMKKSPYGSFFELDGIIRTGGDCHAVVV